MILKKFKIINILASHLINYPTSINLNYNWSFGALSGIFVTIQLITGILLAVHYIAYVEIVFENIEHIMRDVNNGWLLRYIHANSASFFFICMYLHIFRGIFYKSFYKPRNHIWNSGIIILIISIITAFIGYVLPWGQMSFWGATVITNSVTAIPFNIGKYIVAWIWGGSTIQGATLTRFYNFHYLFAIILIILIIMHLSLLHEVGSSNPMFLKNVKEKIKFFRYFYLKDLFMLLNFLIVFFFVVFFYPNILGHSDNYIKANSLITPTHIVPEWYFLPFHAISRSIDNKFFGVITMLLSILILFILPYCAIYIKNFNFFIGITSNNNLFFVIFSVIVIALWFIGSLPAEYPYTIFGKYLTLAYFDIFIFYYFYAKICNKLIRVMGKTKIRV
jgi:quinol-cytochrome oxidoreductase complex cytochrome b subunit